MDSFRNSGQMSETKLTEYVDNSTQNATTHQPDVSGTIFTMMIIQSIIASIGICHMLPATHNSGVQGLKF